jgi:hypothetical protein
MFQTINQPVSVISKYDHELRKTIPVKFKWNGGIHTIEKLGFYHNYKTGTKLFHVFEGVTQSFFFRLIFDSSNLHWKLEKISDGEVD